MRFSAGIAATHLHPFFNRVNSVDLNLVCAADW
jgi:hypothetical protein